MVCIICAPRSRTFGADLGLGVCVAGIVPAPRPAVVRLLVEGQTGEAERVRGAGQVAELGEQLRRPGRVVEPLVEGRRVVVVVAEVDPDPQLDAARGRARHDVRVADLPLEVVAWTDEWRVRIGAEVLRAAQAREVLDLAHEAADTAGVPRVELRIAQLDDAPSSPPT